MVTLQVPANQPRRLRSTLIKNNHSLNRSYSKFGAACILTLGGDLKSYGKPFISPASRNILLWPPSLTSLWLCGSVVRRTRYERLAQAETHLHHGFAYTPASFPSFRYEWEICSGEWKYS